MKLGTKEVLDIIAEVAEEIVNEKTEYSEQILFVMKLMIEKVKNRLFMIEVSDLGLSEEEIKSIINKNEVSE